MSPRLRSVLITGASTGIGKATAVLLAARGFDVYAGFRQDDDGDALADASDHITPVRLDVRNERQVAAAVAQVAHATEGRLWGLVNNAGIVVAGPLEGLPMSEIRDQFEVNVFGLLNVTQACLPLLRAASGRIVNVSSINGRLAMAFNAPYAGSKFAVEALSDGLRLELRHAGIHVSVVEPGAVESAIWETAWRRAVHNLRHLRSEAQAHYQHMADRLAARGAQMPQRAIPAQVVAERIHHALTARTPKTRYVVGWDARLGAMAKRLLPDPVIDWMLSSRRSARIGEAGTAATTVRDTEP